MMSLLNLEYAQSAPQSPPAAEAMGSAVTATCVTDETWISLVTYYECVHTRVCVLHVEG